jgi:SAM-dependent methyltransferase
MDWIFNHAINGGQADFDTPLEDLSPRDRAQLYAYANQKTHVDELIHAFGKLLGDVSAVQNATVIDIGCGPFTSGLALANQVGVHFPYRYFGIDRAKSMLAFGRELADEVFVRGVMHPETVVSFHTHLDNVDFGPRRAAETTIFVLSFLLASSTINVDDLVEEMVRACDRVALGRVIVLYTNAASASARRNFAPFRTAMEKAGFEMHIEAIEQFEDTEKPRPIHYALFLRQPITLSLADF